VGSRLLPPVVRANHVPAHAVAPARRSSRFGPVIPFTIRPCRPQMDAPTPGDLVLVAAEGNGAAQVLQRPRGAIRTVVVGVVDAWTDGAIALER